MGELVLVMKLPEEQTSKLCWNLGTSSAIMIALGYPGEIQDDLAVRWQWWFLAMIPFCYVVSTLVVHLPIRVHREEHWVGRSHSSHLRADRILHCGRGGQGCVWGAHLGHCSREVEHLRHHYVK